MSIDYDSYEDGYEDGKESVLVNIEIILNKWRKESQYREDIASEDWVSNTLNECIEDLEGVIKLLGENND